MDVLFTVRKTCHHGASVEKPPTKASFPTLVERRLDSLVQATHTRPYLDVNVVEHKVTPHAMPNPDVKMSRAK